MSSCTKIARLPVQTAMLQVQTARLQVVKVGFMFEYGCTWSQFPMLHAQNQTSGLGPPQQTPDITQSTAKAHAAHFDPSALTLRALYKLISGVGPLSAEYTPKASAATHVTGYNSCPNALPTLVLSISTCIRLSLNSA